MQQIDVDSKDAYLEALKAQEHQAHEDFLLNPSSEFLQKELSTAREALRSYIQTVQQNSTVLNQQFHDRIVQQSQQEHAQAMLRNQLIHQDNLVHAQERVLRDQMHTNAAVQNWTTSMNHASHAASLNAATEKPRVGYHANQQPQYFPAQPPVQLVAPVIQPLLN